MSDKNARRMVRIVVSEVILFALSIASLAAIVFFITALVEKLETRQSARAFFYVVAIFAACALHAVRLLRGEHL